MPMKYLTFTNPIERLVTSTRAFPCVRDACLPTRQKFPLPPDTQPDGGFLIGQYGSVSKTRGLLMLPIVSQSWLNPYTLISP